MANLGDNLSNYANLDYLEARSTEELLRQLQQIRLPHKIISIYAYGNKHVAWVSLTQKIKKIKKEE
jgi:hypothetical protein